MYDLKIITPVIRHLNKVSPNMYRDLGDEIQIHCPFCDDAQRPHSSNHGHLYLASNAPVFNCFRCGTSGTILRLLLETGFHDDEVIKYISSFIRYNFIKDYSKKVSTSYKQIQNLYINNTVKVVEFKNKSIEDFNKFQKYIIDRIGNVDYNTFFIHPLMLENSLCCGFNNSDEEFITARIISKSKARYINSKENYLYYFQPKNFEIYNRIVIGEGPFDVIPLYLFSNKFKNSLFLSIGGKKYLSAIEYLVTRFILIGRYEINLIYDSDFKAPEISLNRCKFLAEKFNPEILVKGFTPIEPFEDTGDFPQVMEIE